MEHIDPHPEMKDVAVRTSKKRYIIFISSGQGRICGSSWIFMDSFLAECDPNLSSGLLHDSAAGVC
jgi:hypothetical protein